MHERTLIADELDDRPMLHPDDCTCDACLDLLSWMDPTDDDLARRDAGIDRGYRHLAAWIVSGVGLFAGLLVLAVGLTLFTRDVQAQDTRTVTRTINDRPYTWILPEAGCQLLRGWEDMSASAWCPSGLETFDPESRTWYDASTSR